MASETMEQKSLDEILNNCFKLIKYVFNLDKQNLQKEIDFSIIRNFLPLYCILYALFITSLILICCLFMDCNFSKLVATETLMKYSKMRPYSFVINNTDIIGWLVFLMISFFYIISYLKLNLMGLNTYTEKSDENLNHEGKGSNIYDNNYNIIEYLKLNQISPPHTEAENNENTKNYDVIICYNYEDREDVSEINKKLKEEGIKTWFDNDELLGGVYWRAELDKIIPTSKSIAIFFKHTIGKNQKKEIEVFHDYVHLTLIPVFLKDSTLTVEKLNDSFLKTSSSVDFRDSNSDPLIKLISSIENADKKNGSN